MNSFIWKNPANAGGGGNITQLEQKVQQLEQTIQNLTQQIQTITQNLADKAGKAEANNFTQKQKITTPNQALTLVQDNNANYISFETSTSDRRGYVGMGSSGSNKIHLNGKDGVQITSNTGDLELNPAGNINANNKVITNVAVGTGPNDLLTKNSLKSMIKEFTQMGVNTDQNIPFVHTFPQGITHIINILATPSTNSTNPDTFTLIRDWNIQGNNLTINWQGNDEVHLIIIYIE